MCVCVCVCVCVCYLYVLQLVLEVGSLRLEHVGLVQCVLEPLSQAEDVGLLQVHLLLQLPLLG